MIENPLTQKASRKNGIGKVPIWQIMWQPIDQHSLNTNSGKQLS
jgi:hypothetical protein